VLRPTDQTIIFVAVQCPVVRAGATAVTALWLHHPLDKIRKFLRITYNLPVLSLGCIKTPWSDGPNLNRFVAHLLQMKFCYSFVDMLSRFGVTRFRLTAIFDNLM